MSEKILGTFTEAHCDPVDIHCPKCNKLIEAKFDPWGYDDCILEDFEGRECDCGADLSWGAVVTKKFGQEHCNRHSDKHNKCNADFEDDDYVCEHHSEICPIGAGHGYWVKEYKIVVKLND